MRIDLESGIVEFKPELILRRGMKRNEILSIDVNWEEWDIVDDIPRSFRTILSLPNKGMSRKTILVVHVGLDRKPITFWDLAPWDLIEGTQSRPDGKCTKRMRAWFKEMFGVSLPLKQNWGHVDAYFDPWNQSAAVSCSYRDRFNSDDEWSEYKRSNGY